MASDVYRLAGVCLSDESARLLVAVIDAYIKRAEKAGALPPSCLIDLRNSLYAAVVQPLSTSFDECSISDNGLLDLDPSGVVDSNTAAKRIRTTGSNVTDLCRRKRLDSELRNGRWWISSASIDEYVRKRAERRDYSHRNSRGSKRGTPSEASHLASSTEEGSHCGNIQTG